MSLRRRDFITLFGGAAAAWPLAARAQPRQPANRARIAYLAAVPSTAIQGQVHCFLAGLGDLGWIDGKNVSVEPLYYAGVPLAAELVHLSPDLIVATGTRGAQTAKEATQSIPIVFAAVSDPVQEGIVASLARPGGNITGVSNFLPATTGKLLELLRTAVPDASRFCVLYEPANAGKVLEVQELYTAGHTLNASIVPIELRAPEDFELAFSKIEQARCDGLVVLQTNVMLSNSARIAQFAQRARLPSIYQIREFADAGGLMSYGLNYCQHYRRAATYVDKILKGTRPSDLPVELPTTFELIVNLKTAKALGLAVPPTMLALADEVIE
jgi:putative ABC transport system substrate-binding protein